VLGQVRLVGESASQRNVAQGRIRLQHVSRGQFQATPDHEGVGWFPGGISGLASDKALRAASRYLLRQSPKQVVEALNDAIESSQQRGLAHRSVWI
jgi:hypothetical protein